MENVYKLSDMIIYSKRLGLIFPIIIGFISCTFGILLLAIYLLVPPNFIHLSTISTIGIIIAFIFFFFIGVLQFSLSYINYWIVKTVKIVTTPEKIKYYSPGLELHSSWDNIEKISKQINLFGQPIGESLLMKKPPYQKTAWWFTFIRKTPEKEIPLSMFDNWRDTKLGQEIKKYAGKLFQ